jgi:hypothetical protein
MTHLLAEQATVLNETLWETWAKLHLIDKISIQNNALNLSIINLGLNVRDLEATETARWVTWALLDEGLEIAETTLIWLEDLCCC